MSFLMSYPLWVIMYRLERISWTLADTMTNLLLCWIQGYITRLDTLDALQHVGKDDLYSNGDSSYDVTAYFKE